MLKLLLIQGDEFKVIGTQGEWIKVSLEDGEGWLPARYVDIKEATGYVTGEKVNFRKEANVDSDIIEELEIGSSVKVLEVDGNWMKVKKGEDEGYIRSLYVADEAPVIEVEEPVVNKLTSNTQSNTNQNSTSSNNSTNSSNGQAQKPAKNHQNNNSSYNPLSIKYIICTSCFKFSVF